MASIRSTAPRSKGTRNFDRIEISPGMGPDTGLYVVGVQSFDGASKDAANGYFTLADLRKMRAELDRLIQQSEAAASSVV